MSRARKYLFVSRTSLTEKTDIMSEEIPDDFLQINKTNINKIVTLSYKSSRQTEGF